MTFTGQGAPLSEPTGRGASALESALEVRDLRVHYETPQGTVLAVNGVSFHLRRGEILGLVGESGSGKTTVAMALLRLVQPPGRIVGGQILMNGVDLLALPEREFRRWRWRKIALIPQGAMNSLNPVLRVQEQIADVIEAHEGKQPARRLRERIVELLAMVGLPARVCELYPHELSGGMKQRVCIAMAIALTPEIIIADEPTSALDVVVQRLVAQTLLEVKSRLNASLILIGHDMALQAQLADRIAVMYAGKIVEVAPVQRAFARPLHPYTQLLIAAIPSLERRQSLRVAEGLTHDLRITLPGCVFHLRCPFVVEQCRTVVPHLRPLDTDHLVACHRAELWLETPAPGG